MKAIWNDEKKNIVTLWSDLQWVILKFRSDKSVATEYVYSNPIKWGWM